MLGKTHMIIGIASAILFTKPTTIPELMLAVGGGALGGVISDIDVGTSESHKEADKIILFSVGLVVGILAADYFFHTNIMQQILQNSGYRRVRIGVFLFIGICAFGKNQPHRSFMHSFMALCLLCFAIGFVWKEMIDYFAVGFLSHLLLDILNKKRVRLFYPIKKGIALNLFQADGWANKIIFKLGSVVILVELIGFMEYIILKS